MSGDKSRMYSRTTGGAKGRRSSGSTPPPSTAPAPSTSTGGIVDRRRSDHAIGRHLYEKYHGQMGVSSYTLRSLFRRLELTSLKGLEKNITSTQLARIGTFGKSETEELEATLNSRSVSSLEERLLDFALSMKPVDVLTEILEENQNDADVRELLRLVTEDTLEGGGELPRDARLAAVLTKYQSVVDADVALMSGTGDGDKHAQIRDIARLARDCFDSIDGILQENRANKPPPEEGGPITAESMRASKEHADEPGRITSRSMQSYRENQDRTTL